MPSLTAPTPLRSSSGPASRSEAGPAAAAGEGLAVYVHWPFCLSKCPYCDFNSHLRERIDEARWRRAYVAEIRHYGERLPRRRVASVFFGGGTPSLMAAGTVAAVLDAIAGAWPVAADVEITLEANPTSAEARRFAGYRTAGVNRLSLGVQSFDDRALGFLGRGHSADEARAALTLAQRHFARTSFDLIYARPGQTLAAWKGELGEALARAGGHLSPYQLTIEAGTAFHRAERRGALTLPGDDVQARLFEATQALCEAAGMPAYEISNHARPGEECRHNLVYWRSGEYLGIGPGAHGRLNLGGVRRAQRAIRAPEAWLAAVESRGHGREACEPLAAEVRVEEFLMMGLRLRQGISRRRFAAGLGRRPEEVIDARALADLVDGGFLALDGEGLRASERGRAVLNAVLGRLLA